MNPYLLLLLVGTSASIMNMLPWGGPLGRTAAVLGMDVTELWRPLIKVQVIGLVLLIGLAVLLAIREKRLIAKRGDFNEELYEEAQPLVEGAQDEASLKAAALRRPKLLWVNTLLAIAVIGILVWGIIPAGFAL